MPSNKWGEWQVYLEAYQLGLIDKVEALKKTEIFDKDGILQRADEIAQLQGQLQQAEEQIKELSGDLQTARRESVSARQRTEVEKYKTKLSSSETQTKADAKVAVGKLENVVKLEQVSEKLRQQRNGQPRKEKS